MTYPPPGGENPQYQLQPEPQQPSDPYSQGYNSTPPPPANYYPQQQPPPQYTQPQYSQPQYAQPPTQPMMPPQVGVQQGYPSAPGSVLPPPMPPAKQGGNLTVILAVVVGLVVVLGIAAVLIIPGMLKDDGDDQAGGGDPSSSAEPSKEEETSEQATEPSEEAESATPEASGSIEGWGAPVSEDDFDPNTPEGAAITYQIAQDTGDDTTLASVVSASPTDEMSLDLEYESSDDSGSNGWPFFAMSKEVDGQIYAWAGYTYSDTKPTTFEDIVGGATYIAVEEDGTWKLKDWLDYGLVG
jgi:hypothetical protein